MENSENLNTKELAVLNDRIKELGRLTKVTYKQILSTPPPASIIKHHKHGDFDYLPITAVERLLDGLFDGWTPEILREGQAFNGFYVVLRLTAHIPNSNKSLVADGIGFAEIQTRKGASPTDFSQIIASAGVMAIPKAKAEAIKNAAKSFGNLFGRNLARNDDRLIAEAQVVNQSRTKIANTLKASEAQNATN